LSNKFGRRVIDSPDFAAYRRFVNAKGLLASGGASHPKEKTMKSYHANSGAGIAGLTLREHDQPKPGPHEVLIRVRTNSLNFRELMVLRGNYP
jgi:hypothetical protein